MKWLEIEFQGRPVRVPAVKAQGQIWFHWQGETYVVEAQSGSTSSARRASGEKGKSQPGVITAPMPGKVTHVGVKVGETVVRGQVLVAMEAMKMEYTLEADIEGKVSEIHVTPGSQVTLGQVLARVSAT